MSDLLPEQITIEGRAIFMIVATAALIHRVERSVRFGIANVGRGRPVTAFAPHVGQRHGFAA